MADSQTELKNKAIGLSSPAFEAFCDDISGMFGIEMKCAQKEAAVYTIKEVSQKFKKLAAVTNVHSEGVLKGNFHIVFDQAGLFTLGGIIIMLPRQRIIDSVKRGTAADAEGLFDTIKESGNLLVGSWDRIFREEMQGHGHFLQSNTYIGNPWDNPQQKLGLAQTEQFSFVSYQISIDGYSPFMCGVIFPEAIFASPPQTPQVHESKSEDKEPTEIENTEQETTLAESKKEEPVVQGSEEVQAVQPSATPVSDTIRRMAEAAGIKTEDSFSSFKTAVKDVMQTKILWGSPDESVQQAINKMQQADTAYMLIGSDGTAEAIVSTYDIASAVSIYLKPAFAKWRSPADDATLQIRLKWIMTRALQTIKSDNTIEDAMRIMCQTGLRCLPVVDNNGKSAGLITVFDIMKSLLKKNSESISTHSLQPVAAV